MNECQRPKQIHLIDSLLYCFEKWRWIVACMLIAAVVLGVNAYLSAVKENRAIQDAQPVTEDVEESDSNNMEEMTAQVSIGSYERAIEEMERDLEIQEDYLERSVVMQLEPYHISTGILSYYAEGAENMNSVVAAYSTFISSGRMAEELYAQDADVPVEDLRYLISISNIVHGTSGEDSVFQIQIKMPDSELSGGYLKRAEEIMRDFTSQLQTRVAEHQLTLLSSVQSELADVDIQKYQSTVRTTYMTSVRNLQTLRNEAKASQAVPEEQSTDSEPKVAVVLKNPMALAKQSAVKGLLWGACGACVVLIMFYLFGERLQAIENFDREYGMSLLGVVRVSETKRKKFGFIDSWIFRLRGGSYGRIGFDEQIKIAAANIQASIARNTQDGKQPRIMLAGTIAEKEAEIICAKLASEIEGVFVSPYKQLVFESSALSELETYDGVILIEKRGSSHCEFIEQERKLVLDRDVEVLGAIVTC